LLFVICPAFSYEIAGIDLTATGTIGTINPDFETPLFINDWRIRRRYDYEIVENTKIGLMYSWDGISYNRNRLAHDAFVFAEDRDIGRLELGLTDSVAKKMGLGLPDVGGLRINEEPIFYTKIHQNENIISNLALTTDYSVPRINLVSAGRDVQYGISVAGLTNKYRFTTDAALKFRDSLGKTKAAYVLGLSLTGAPSGFQPDMFTSPVVADWRAQVSGAVNVQYNSWIFGATARAIYDYNQIGISSDGIVMGLGASYDLLKYTISASYVFSDTGVWDDATDYMSHTGLVSFRYKYNENVNMWMSIGITRDTPFFGVGIGGKI
jgi:hypothetical protein